MRLGGLVHYWATGGPIRDYFLFSANCEITAQTGNVACLRNSLFTRELFLLGTAMSTKISPPYIIPNSALDIGFFSVKGASKRETTGGICNFSFPSQIARVTGSASVSMGMESLSGVYIKDENNCYFVGTDAALQSSARQTRTVTENFVDTNDYQILFLAGLHYILRDHHHRIGEADTVEIKRLIMGLPLNTVKEYADKVREMFEGTHMVPSPVGSGEIKVVIRSIAVIPQPQGAMVIAGSKRKKEELKEFFGQNMLVLDIGGGTFDWFLVTSNKVVESRSGAFQKGIITCVNAVCDGIKPGIKEDPLVLKRVDEALRNESERVIIGGKKYSLAEFMPQVDSILAECLNAMFNKMLSLDSVDLIIFTGGGAKRLHHVATQMWPDRAEVMELDSDPVFSNVSGFYYLGEMKDATAK